MIRAMLIHPFLAGGMTSPRQPKTNHCRASAFVLGSKEHDLKAPKSREEH